jgi:hypothetical protein
MTTKKKWAIGIGVFLAFGLLGAILDDDKSSTSGKNKAEPQQLEQTEQKQEQEAEERQAREQKEETERQAREQKQEQEKKKKEIAEKGYKDGYDYGFTTVDEFFNLSKGEGFSDVVPGMYTMHYDAPSSPEGKEQFNIYLENFKRGATEGHNAR